MVPIGIDVGGALGPLTAGGTADDAPQRRPGPRVTSVAHQDQRLTRARRPRSRLRRRRRRRTLGDGALLAHRIASPLTAGAIPLALASVIAIVIRHSPAPQAPGADDVVSSSVAMDDEQRSAGYGAALLLCAKSACRGSVRGRSGALGSMPRGPRPRAPKGQRFQGGAPEGQVPQERLGDQAGGPT
jgi:hypothetical protein